MLPEAAIPALNAFVLFFSLPCMLFRFGAATPVGELLQPAMAAGAPLSTFNLMMLALAAAMPSASNVSLLAEPHGADTGRAARITMSSTVPAFASISALAWLFGAGRR